MNVVVDFVVNTLRNWETLWQGISSSLRGFAGAQDLLNLDFVHTILHV